MNSEKSESQHARQEYSVADGLSEITKDIPPVIEMIARTARWVHPEIFRALPVWCPDTARGLPRYDARWSRILCNRRGQEKREENIRAANALVEALGVKGRPKPKNWTACHIWGYDDPDFPGPSKVVQSRRYYSCVGNMVWLPTPLKGFTDAVPEIKLILRLCAFHLYGWACEHPDIADQAREVRSGSVPSDYPTVWPTAERRVEPPGLAPASDRAWRSVEKAKAKIRQSLADTSLEHYPRAEVQKVLESWKITL